jgi:hypothetical protein
LAVPSLHSTASEGPPPVTPARQDNWQRPPPSSTNTTFVASTTCGLFSVKLRRTRYAGALLTRSASFDVALLTSQRGASDGNGAFIAGGCHQSSAPKGRNITARGTAPGFRPARRREAPTGRNKSAPPAIPTQTARPAGIYFAPSGLTFLSSVDFQGRCPWLGYLAPSGRH